MKQFYKKNKLALNISIGIITVFWIFFFGLYGKYDLFRFPFDSNVWGTFSDWLMVIVTTLTAIYLVKTFKEQQKITIIENDRFLNEILPIPKIECQLVGDNNGEIRITFNKNPGFNVIITNKSSKELTFKSIKNICSAPSFSTNMPMVEKFTFSNDLNKNELTIAFEIYFSDKIGTKYFQEFAGMVDRDLICRPPLLKDYEFSY